MHNTKRTTAWLVMLLSAAMLLTACGGKAQTPAQNESPAAAPAAAQDAPKTPKIQGRLTWSAVGEPVNLNPILQSDTNSTFVVQRVFSGLVMINEKLEVAPDIATSWTKSDDGLQWTFKLRNNVKFHDGKPMTAEDVAFTYNAMKDKGYTGPRSGDFAALEKVEVVDPYTVKFILKQPFAPFLANLTYGILPKHLYDAKPVAEMKDNPANRKPVGTGPWKLGEWIPGQYLTLIRHDDFYANGPYIPEMIVKFVQDGNVGVAKLEAGEFDIGAVPSSSIKRFREKTSDVFNFYPYQGLGFEYLAFNTTKPGLNEKAVRQAIAYAIDRQKVVSDILEGEGVVLNAPVPPASWAYSEKPLRYTVDKAKAIKLLEDAGYTKGADGIYAKNGQRLAFTITTNTGSSVRESECLFIQKALKDIGIDLQINLVELATFQGKVLPTGNFDMTLNRANLNVDPDPYTYFHSSQAQKNAKGTFVGFNIAQYSNPALDKLLEDGRKEIDQAKRKEIYGQYQDVIAEDVPWLVMFNYKSTYAIKKNVKGVVMSPIGPTQGWLWYTE
ncbi:MAG TPA: peptide-binding protein [Symbiobacteriaceae bacterium]|jgi:peptide/nickel transport system substrate-binding protein|nr:peptide-binding protein [Symbiobacteriaceae bacterium]